MQSLVLRDYAHPSVNARGHTLPHLPLRGARVLPLRHCEELVFWATWQFLVPKNHPLPSSSLRGGAPFAPTKQSLVPTSPHRHCEEGRFLSRRGNLWYRGTVRAGMKGPQKRDCHASLRRLAMTIRKIRESALRDCYGATKQPLAMTRGERGLAMTTQGNTKIGSRRLPRTLRVLAMTGVWCRHCEAP